MNTTLASLPPPAFGDLAARGVAPAAGAASTWFEAGAEESHATLHARSAAPRAIDDIERDFVDALCESRPA